MSFRLVVQPAVAVFLAVRAGLNDARAGRPAFLWAAMVHANLRREMVRHGWKDVRNVFITAAVLDSIYQLIVHRGVYVGELLATATLLVIIPYVLLRGPVNRIAGFFLRKTGSAAPAAQSPRTR